MSDLISRQAAIDALNKQIKYCDNALGSFDISMKDEYAVKVERASLCAYVEVLESLPSTDVPRWIPVTERLPEDDTVVLVCGRKGGVYSAIHNNSRSWWRGWWKLNSKNHHCEPIAWMPLPEPYREEKE